MWFVADGSSQLLLTLCGFPEAVGVQVDTRAGGDIRRPAAEYSVAVVGPAVVDPFLNTKVNKHLEKYLVNIETWERALLSHAYVFAEEADPHGHACAAHVHSEGGLQEGVGHTRQVHVVVSALL